MRNSERLGIGYHTVSKRRPVDRDARDANDAYLCALPKSNGTEDRAAPGPVTMSLPLVVPRKEKGLAAALLFVLLAAVHYDVVCLGQSFVLTNHYNPLDYRPLAQNYGEDLVPADVWVEQEPLLVRGTSATPEVPGGNGSLTASSCDAPWRSASGRSGIRTSAPARRRWPT